MEERAGLCHGDPAGGSERMENMTEQEREQDDQEQVEYLPTINNIQADNLTCDTIEISLVTIARQDSTMALKEWAEKHPRDDKQGWVAHLFQRFLRRE